MEKEVVENRLWIDCIFRPGQFISTGGKAQVAVHDPVTECSNGKTVHRQVGSSLFVIQANRKVTGDPCGGTRKIILAGLAPCAHRTVHRGQMGQVGIGKFWRAQSQEILG